MNICLTQSRSDGGGTGRQRCLGRRVAVLAAVWICQLVLALPTSAQLNNSAAYTFTTLAGFPGTGSADGVGSNARFAFPTATAVDSEGNLYVADRNNNTIRQITPAGVVSTIAGLAGYAGSADGTNGTARFNSPTHIAIDSVGNLYVVDKFNYTIRKITRAGANWVVSTLAGIPGIDIYGGDTASTATFFSLGGIAVDPQGNVYVTDDSTIRQITTAGAVNTLAGQPGITGTRDATNEDTLFDFPPDIAVDNSGNLYVPDGRNFTIREVSSAGTNWVSSTIAGSAGQPGSTDGLGSDARFGAAFTLGPGGIATDTNGNVFVADTYNNTIRRLTPVGPDWMVTTLAGNASGTNQFGQSGECVDGTGTNALFDSPLGLSVDAAGNIFVADFDGTIRKVTSAGVVTTVAGSPLGQSGGSADGTGPAARFDGPDAVAVDGSGNIFVADAANDTIRELTAAGVVSTIAGQPGVPGSADGVGAFAQFYQPAGVAVDKSGNVYVADSLFTIRQITAAGVVTTIAGLAGNRGTNDGLGTNASFYYPSGVAVDHAGNLYVADSLNDTIREITPMGSNWMVSTIAGTAGTSGSNDGTNDGAMFNQPSGVAVDQNGNVFVSDTGNNTIRELTQDDTNWIVTTVAGNAAHTNQFGQLSGGYQDGIGTNALFLGPQGITVDKNGDLFVADAYNVVIRKLSPSGGGLVVSTVGGLPGTRGAADGAGNAALFNSPQGIGVDASGTLYVADRGNNTISKGVFTGFGGSNPAPYTPPVMTGRLMVTLIPAAADGQWRFPWEVAWRDSGTIASNLAPDNYTIEYKNIPGYLTITTNYTVGVTNGGTIFVTNQYYPTALAPTNGAGTLTVNMPNAPSGAAWGFLGGSNSLPSGFTTNLVPGAYLVGFQPVAGYSTPANLSVQVVAGEPSIISVSYLVASPAPANVLLPVQVPTANIADITDYPFGFNGQLLSDTGYGSGVAVQTNVVLTAAHVVFNDDNLSYSSQAYWFFRQEAGTFSPEPIAARGWYILGGYAAQRTNDLAHGYSVDESSAESRNMDVAALYFTKPMAGGGFGGYLPSDTVPNQWLSGTTEKMLVGYPVDGSLFGDASIVPGKMYQTLPQRYPMNLDPNQVIGQQEVYDADWFLGYPGDSGGPVYVKFNDYYYPAGVYLGIYYNGSSFVTLVRGLDSNVVNMVTLVQLQGDGGTNNTGGGVITIIPNAAVSAANPGYVQWKLEPPAAVADGAGWRLAGDTSYSNATNYTRSVLNTNAVVVQFKSIAGWSLPPSKSISVQPNEITVSTGFYTVASPMLKASPGLGIGLIGTTGTTYRIESRISLTTGAWQPVVTNTITSNGFNLVLPPPAGNQPATFYRAVWLP